MKKNQIQLTLAVLCTALFLLTLAALSAIGGFVLGRGAPGLLTTVARIAGGLAALGLLAAAGRERWNLSELNDLRSFQRESLPDQIAQNVRSSAMPPSDYLSMHPAARLTEAEKEQLIRGLQGVLAKQSSP